MLTAWNPKSAGGIERCLPVVMTVLMLGVPISSVAQNNGWVAKSPMPTPREQHASCLIGQHVYLMGGSEEKAKPVLKAVYRYSIETDSWEILGDMPTARRNLTASVVNGKCYTFGGEGAQDFGITNVDEYDPVTGNWTAKTDMPTPRQAPASAVIDNIIYVVGGHDGAVFRNTLEAYDPATDSWSSLAPMNTGRGYLTAAAVNGKLYVLGGNPAFGDPVNTVEEYDPATDQWSEVAGMPNSVFFLTASTVGDKVYAIGGATGAAGVDEVNIYDSITGKWSSGVPMLSVRNRHASEVIQGAIYVFGGATAVGGNPHGTMDTVEAFQAEEYTFSINPGLSDAWFNAATAGQGFFIIVFPDRKQIFLAWFTYDTERPPGDVEAFLGERGHRWLTAQGPYEGDTAMLDVYSTEGGVFDMSEPQPMTGDPIGTIKIVWTDCENATLTYDIDLPLVSGEIELTRITLDNVALCEAPNE